MALNVLVVDDSAVARAMVIKTLKLSGLPLGELRQAGDGRQGLAALEQGAIDLVLTDINMPEMDGEEMVRHIRETPDWANLPLVVISTEGSQRRIERLRQAGVRFIHKPFTPEAIRDTVTELLGVSP